MMQGAERDIGVARDEKRKVAVQMKEVMFAKNEVEAEIGALKTKYKSEVEGLEKLEPIFQTLKKLRSLIREKNIQGYKGLLIDFLDFDPKISSIVDLAAKSKLFSIIVEDLDTAKELLSMNAQIKGGVINIYPLQIIDQLKSDKQRTYPNLQEVRPLTKFVTLKPNSDPRLAKLVQNTFSKVVMVTNYPLAMQVAKEHNLTCITPDHQIVYAGAFITQVGQFNRMTMDRPTLYRRISGIEGQIEEKVVQAFGFEKHRDQLADRDLEAMRKLQRAEVNIASLKSGYQQMKSMLFEYRSQVEYKQSHTAEVERHIEEYQAQEAEIEVKIRALEGQAKQSGEVFSSADSLKLVEVNKMIDELGRKLAAQESERMQTLGKIKSKKSLLNEKYLKKQNDIQLNMLEQEMNGKEGAMQGSQSQLTMCDIDKERAEVEGQIQRYMADLESKNKELKALY